MAIPRNLANIAPAMNGSGGKVTIGGSTPLGTFNLVGLSRPSGVVTYTTAEASAKAQAGLNWYEDNNANFEYYLDIFATSTNESPWAGSNIRMLTTPVGTTTAVERARITRDGNLLVGTTSGSGGGERVNITGSVGNNLARFVNSNASPYGPLFSYSGATPNGTGNEFLTCTDGTQRAAIRSNGGIANYSGNNVNLSDRREKTNFAPAKSYLDVICSIPVQTFNYIDQNMEEDGGLTLGVVAQDVQAVAPELVMESNWAKEDEEPKMRLSIYQTDLQYALMKAIQEQQTIIESLKTRLDAANL